MLPQLMRVYHNIGRSEAIPFRRVRVGMASGEAAPTVDILTTDGEEFEVPLDIIEQFHLCRGDIAAGVNPLKIPLDSGALGKLLLCLECDKLDANHVDEVKEAAQVMQVRPVLARVAAFMSKFPTREDGSVVEHSWEEFCKHQRKGDFWIIVDYQIYDISEWIRVDEKGHCPHPGGTMPLQAFKKDSTYYFEIYHATSDSYRLLKNFYVGRLRSEDMHLVQGKAGCVPSQEFYETLRAFTDQYAPRHNESNSTS